jgi:hypothetical protein
VLAKYTTVQQQEEHKAVLGKIHSWQENLFRKIGMIIDCYLHYLGRISYKYDNGEDNQMTTYQSIFRK